MVQELVPGCTAGDLVAERGLRTGRQRDSVAASASPLASAVQRTKVNCVFVEDFHQKLRMGDLVEFADELEFVPDGSQELQPTGSPGERCGQIAVEFQREQLKRLYLDGGADSRWPPSPRLDRTPSSLAGLS